jgi:hypothetical protein
LKINGTKTEENKMGVKVIKENEPAVNLPDHENLVKVSAPDIYEKKTLQLLEY